MLELVMMSWISLVLHRFWHFIVPRALLVVRLGAKWLRNVSRTYPDSACNEKWESNTA